MASEFMSGFSNPETEHWSDGASSKHMAGPIQQTDILDDLFGYFQPESQIGMGADGIFYSFFFLIVPQTSNSRTQTNTHTNIRWWMMIMMAV